MQYAVNANEQRILADDANKSGEYYCPICAGRVIPRQGECNRWHFAHTASCEDQWQYDMSDWHLAWQEKYPTEARESIIEFDGIRHRADVLLGSTVIEFQHSPISAAEFGERNRFYTKAGYKVLWVFDMARAFLAEQIVQSDEDASKYYWRHPSRILSSVLPQDNRNIAIVLELDDGSESDAIPWLVKIEWAKPSPDGSRADYSTFITDDNFEVSLTTEEDILNLYLNKWDRFNAFLLANQPYVRKCSRMRGNPRSWYICEKTQDWHHDACKGCKYNLVSEYRNATPYHKGGRYYYCKYPTIVETPDNYGMIQGFSVRL